MIALLIVAALLAITVSIHYEGLRLLSGAVQSLRINPRPRMVVVIFGVMAVHVLEIATYAGAYWFGDEVADIGDFGGIRAVTARDYFYFSAETYTSLGIGDVYPVGDLRLIASLEVLNGLLLIGWSTSFTYLFMLSYWKLHDNGKSG